MLTSKNDRLSALTQISVRNDSVRVASLLKHERQHNTPTLDEPLLKDSSTADEIYQHVFCSRSTYSGEDFPDHSFIHSVRAMLLSPPVYELPWKTAVEFIVGTQSFFTRESRPVITEIQNMLQQAAASWWDERRRLISSDKRRRPLRLAANESFSDSTPRHWILRLVSVAMEPMFTHDHDLSPGLAWHSDHWESIVDVVTTAMSLSKDLDAALFDSCLDVTLCQEVRPGQLLPWIHLAANLRSCLSLKDWALVRGRLSKHLYQEPNLLRIEHLSCLTEVVFSLIISENMEGSDFTERTSEWMDMLQRIMLLASSDLPTLALVEKELRRSLASVSTSSLGKLAETSSTATHATKPIRAVLLLFIWHTINCSGTEIVSSLVAKALILETRPVDIACTAWDQIVRVAIPAGYATRADTSPAGIMKLQHLLRKTSYLGKGKFDCGDENLRSTLNEAGAVVIGTLRPEPCPQDSAQCPLAQERAQAWMECIFDILEAKCSEPTMADLIFVVVVMTTILWEVRSFRCALVCKMSTAILNDCAYSSGSSHVSAVLSAVLALLLTSEPNRLALELDDLSAILPRLPLLPLTAFAKTLVVLPSAGRTLLAHATSQLSRKIDAFTGTGQDVRCGLFALVVLVSSSDWSEYERLSWSLLSELLVNCRPMFSASVRSWLFAELKGLVEEERMSRSTGDRLLLACVTRLFSMIGPNQQGHLRFQFGSAFETWFDDDAAQSKHSKQVEDTFGLLGLVTHLLHFCASEAAERQSIVDRWRSEIASAIDCWRTMPAVSNRVPFSVPPVSHGDDFLFNAGMYCLAYIIQEALDTTFSFHGDDLEQLSDLGSILLKKERMNFIVSTPDNAFPRWLQSGTKQAIPSGVGEALLQSFRVAAIDLTIDLVSNRRSDSPSIMEDHEKEKRCLRLCALLSLRRKYGTSLAGNPQKRTNYDPDAFVKALGDWSKDAVAVFEKKILKQCNVDEADELFSALLDLNDVVKTSTTSLHLGMQLQQFCPIVWRSYMLLGTEVAVRSLIRFLENQHNDDDSSLSDNESKVSDNNRGHLRSARSPASIDSTVRKARLSTLEAVQVCLSSAVSRLESHAQSETQKILPSSLEFILQTMKTLCLDVRLGLDGSSGGLTQDIYVLYLDCVDSCCSLLMGSIDDMATTEFGFISNVCKSAMHSIRDIPCSFDIKQSAAFKKTLMLSLCTIPAIGRALQRLSVFGTISSKHPPFFHLHWASPLATEWLRHCVAFAGREIALRLTQSETSDEELQDQEDASLLNVSLTDTTTVQRMQDNPVKRLVLNSERSCIWAMSCTLQSMENDWEESQRILQQNGDLRASTTESLTDVYLSHRSKHLSAYMAEITLLLSKRLELPNEKAPLPITPLAQPQESTDPHLVSGLSAAVKTRLCALVNRMLWVLQRATRHLLGVVRQGRTKGAPWIERLATAEALSCLLAWLLSKEGTDLSTALQQWQGREERLVSNKQPANASGFLKSDDATKRRLGQIASRLDDTTAALQDLDDLLQKPGKAKVSLAEHAIDRLVAAVAAEGKQEPTASLRDLVRIKVELLLANQQEQQAPRKRKAAAAASARWNPDMERRARKERSKRAVRSRNPVVDKWLQIDRDLDDERKDDHDDGFADLEDFLVDG